MQYLTEQDLMARCGLGQGVELHLSPEERLTPSAQELVNNRKIRILIVSGDGRVARDDGKAVHPLATEERPFAKVEKTEAQTHLNGTEMVTKEHPRIWFRGKVDSAIAAAILVQTQLQPVLAPELQGLLADLRSWLGWAMRCEVLDEAVPVLSMGPFSREAVRRLACHPEELGLEPLCPDAAEGSIFTLLNWLRAIIRETEVAAAFAFRKQDGTLERPDILELLDGLSNAVYAFMLLVKAGDRAWEPYKPRGDRQWTASKSSASALISERVRRSLFSPAWNCATGRQPVRFRVLKSRIAGSFGRARWPSRRSRTWTRWTSQTATRWLPMCAITRRTAIISCAAFTNVDGCETNREAAFAVNALGARNLAMAAEEIGAKLVHVSTDYVFSGDAAQPVWEYDLPAPRSVYGKTKLLGEQYVQQFCTHYFIVRTAWLYGYAGNNFVKTMLRLARQNGGVTVVDDQLGNPTNAADLAHEILNLLVTKEYGVYHCTGEGVCSWCEFAAEIIRLSGIPATVTPCTTEQFIAGAKKQIAPRPAYSALENAMLKATIGNEMRDWKTALACFFENYKPEE